MANVIAVYLPEVYSLVDRKETLKNGHKQGSKIDFM